MKLSVNKFRVFAIKEFTENLRTKKLFSIACVFIFIALLSVLMARFVGEIFELLLSAEGGTPFIIEIPDPVWTDSYAQLYSNLSEIGLIVFIMMYMGVILKEKNTGSIDLMMSKGLSPATFVLAKFFVAAVIALVTLFLAVLITYVYTLILFDYGGQIGNVLCGAMSFGVFLLLMLGVTLMWSAIAKSTAISAVLGLVSYFVIRLFDIIPQIGQFMPGRLIGHSTNLSFGATVENMVIQILVAIAATILCLCIAVHVLKHREG